MNCSFCFRSAAAASTSCSPACAVNVIFSGSIFTILFKPFMLTIVPVEAAQGVSE
jgi:hypothetical protein